MDPEWDKLGHGDVAPINDAVANALDAHLRRYPVIGDGRLFPDARGPSEPMNRARAANLLRKAERAAGLEKIRGLGWHGFRRAWATARTAMPLADVQRVGGWRDAVSLQRCYQGRTPRRRSRSRRWGRDGTQSAAK